MRDRDYIDLKEERTPVFGTKTAEVDFGSVEDASSALWMNMRKMFIFGLKVHLKRANEV